MVRALASHQCGRRFQVPASSPYISMRRKGWRIGRKGKKEGDWGEGLLSLFSPFPFPFAPTTQATVYGLHLLLVLSFTPRGSFWVHFPNPYSSRKGG